MGVPGVYLVRVQVQCALYLYCTLNATQRVCHHGPRNGGACGDSRRAREACVPTCKVHFCWMMA